MNEEIKNALEQERTIDITTRGKKSGEPRRKEIWFHNIDGRIYITGTPGTRDWYANMIADPDFTFHLKQSVQADIPARATPVRDEAERRRVLEAILQNLEGDRDINEWLKDSPLVEVALQI
ncbi:MAG: nitroreductase family deazaflavin-dependent oxidoreductase [Chloroflexi bacterium]|nr:nitroreductase family deazaflavin-dependent oxidoreductase [Chloroflexota bacterium]